MLKIEGTFLPHTGEDFWPLPAEEFSLGCDCSVGTDEPTLLPVELVLKLPLLCGDPTSIGDTDWLLVGISCPCGDKPDFRFTPNDIWVWPCSDLDGCWGKFLTPETLVTGEAGVLAEFFHGVDCAAVLLGKTFNA